MKSHAAFCTSHSRMRHTYTWRDQPDWKRKTLLQQHPEAETKRFRKSNRMVTKKKASWKGWILQGQPKVIFFLFNLPRSRKRKRGKWRGPPVASSVAVKRIKKFLESVLQLMVLVSAFPPLGDIGHASRLERFVCRFFWGYPAGKFQFSEELKL